MGNGPSAIDTSIPDTQKAFYIVEKNADFNKIKVEVRTIPVPKPSHGQVLVRVVAAPVNPSDYGKWARPSENDKPSIAGLEGSGVVVASGGGYAANGMIGKNIGFVNVKNGGTYQQYVIVDASFGAFPLPSTLKCEDAASHFVNPYTACGFIDTVRKRHTGNSSNVGFVHTAACSQLGQMLIKLAKEENVTLINVVRRKEQVDILTKIGAENIINTSDADWKEQLGNKIKELGINVIFDAISGEMSGILTGLLPNGGTHFAYGTLGGRTCEGVLMTDLSYNKKNFEGWLLTHWILEHGKGLSTLLRINAATKTVHRGLENNGWSSSKYLDCKLDNMWEMFLDMKMKSGFTGKKLRIRFDQEE